MSRDYWKGAFTGAIFSVAVGYSSFRIYRIMKIGLDDFRWYDILLLYLFIAAFFLGISYALYKRGKLRSPAAQKRYLLIFGFFASFYIAEISLRILRIGTTYSEGREGVFVNPADRTQKIWYMRWLPHQKVMLTASEYSFSRTVNAEGASDKEWNIEKDTNEIRIITLGDSFTEGDGCAQDSAYPRVLERMLQTAFPLVKINVMNAGRIGSDPWFEYKKLEDRLVKYKPDIVVYTNGSNDLFFDHLYYGGMERFAPDSTVKHKIPDHKWLGLYVASYVFRRIMRIAGYDETLISEGDREKDKAAALADARELSHQYSNLAVRYQFTCVQLLRPDKSELQNGEYDYNPATLTEGTDMLPSFSTCDLLNFYKDSLYIGNSNVDDYFWRIDQHHNAKGYAAMAKAVFSCLKPVVSQKIQEAE